MNPHSLRLVVLAFACVILGSAFTKKTNPIKLADPTVYYWYVAGTDSFWDSNNTSNEIIDQENATGYLVNTIAAGGTLLVKGYINSNSPHNVLPSVLLYGH